MTMRDFLQIKPGATWFILIIIVMAIFAVYTIAMEIKSCKNASRRYFLVWSLSIAPVLLIASLILLSAQYNDYKKAIDEGYTVYIDGVEADVDPLQAMKTCDEILDHDKHWILCSTRYSETESYFNDFNKTIPEADQ